MTLQRVAKFLMVPVLMFVWVYAPVFLLLFSNGLRGIRDEHLTQTLMAAFSFVAAIGMTVLSIWCTAALKRELKTQLKTRGAAIAVATFAVLLVGLFAPHGNRLVDALKELHDIGSVGVLTFVGVWLFGLAAFVTVTWDNAVNYVEPR